MSDPSGQTPLHLLIVATNPKGLQTAQRYLERRDVICSVVKSVKEAVGYVTKHKPGFVMLSWNLEGVNPVKIMQVLTQSFSVKVIVFAERGDTSTSLQISNCGAPYTLQMPINGPKILIRLQNIIREEQELKDNPEKERTRSSMGSVGNDSDKGNIHLSSSGSKANDTIVMKGSAAKDGTFNGTAGISNSGTRNGGGEGGLDSDAAVISNSLNNRSSDGSFMGQAPGTRGRAPQGYSAETEKGPVGGHALGGQGLHSGQGYTGTGEAGRGSRGNLDPGSVDHRAGREGSEGDLKGPRKKARQPGDLSGPESDSATEPGVSANLSKASREGQAPSLDNGSTSKKNRTFKGSGEKAKANASEDEPGVSGQLGRKDKEVDAARSSGAAGASERSSAAGARSGAQQRQGADAPSLPQRDTQVKGPRSQGILADSVKTVVKEVSRRTTEEAKTLQGTRQISVLTVNSPRFHGYLIAAHGANKKIDLNFAAALKARLIDHLKKQGEAMKDNEADFEMEIQKVEFGAWAEEFADFLALSQHEDSELAVAFVGGDPKMGQVDESASADMMSCQLKDFTVGEPVQCDMFLHLKKNDKYVRYLKQGAPLTQEQKDRLLKKEVKDLHFNKSDLMKYKEYIGKSFIRNKLGESTVFVKKNPTDKSAA